MRRTRIDVICSILGALEEGPLKPTRLMYRANLSHELLKKYIEELTAAGLIKEVKNNKVLYELTEQGMTYLKEYKKFLKFSATFGL